VDEVKAADMQSVVERREEVRLVVMTVEGVEELSTIARLDVVCTAISIRAEEGEE
jgi:hypothetical protein